jgi:uncharacterized membrane protein YvbJ
VGKMVKCKCGSINPENAKYCQECGTSIKELDSMWLVAAVLFPIIGLIGGLYYASKGRRGTGKVIAVSIGAWIFFVIIVNLF